MSTPTVQSAPAKKQRDLRLDFFRGMAMFIILLAHTPHNSWTLWIPARFGFSDATEIFVFCSGMASGIAFGAVYLKKSWFLGTARIAFRVWQVYWAHIGVVIATALLMVVIDQVGFGKPDKTYANWFPVNGIFNNTGPTLMGLFTLTYIPGLFDILPMYLVILAMVPLVMAIYKFGGREGVFAFIAVVWVCANLAGYSRKMADVEDMWAIQEAFAWLGSHLTWMNLPGMMWSKNPDVAANATWFFNPFAWQLVFFTGFCFAMGWIPAPPVKRWLVYLAAGVVLLTIPLAWHKMYQHLSGYVDATGSTMVVMILAALIILSIAVLTLVPRHNRLIIGIGALVGLVIAIVIGAFAAPMKGDVAGYFLATTVSSVLAILLGVSILVAIGCWFLRRSVPILHLLFAFSGYVIAGLTIVLAGSLTAMIWAGFVEGALWDIRGFIEPLRWKTWIGGWRFLHFLAIAYLAWAAVGQGGIRLTTGWDVKGRSGLFRMIVAGLAVIALVLTAPYTYIAEIKYLLPALDQWFFENIPLIDGRYMGMLHLVHLTALIFFIWHTIGNRARTWLVQDAFLAVVPVIRKVGTQSLAVFLVSIVLSRFNGAWIEHMDAWLATTDWTYVTQADVWVRALVNLTGFGILIATAYGVGWIKRQPWRDRAPRPATETPKSTDRTQPVPAE